MTTLREAAQQALEAMDKATRFMRDSDYVKLNQAIDALRASLPCTYKCEAWPECACAAQQEQEPVAWVDETSIAWLTEHPRGIITTRLVLQKSPERQMPLYTHPPRRKWQSLTDEEIGDVFQAARNAKLGPANDNSRHRLSVVEIARAVEAKLKEKNNG